MNRRNVLVALGAVAILTGIVFGTGAFTQVEAERTVTVEFADDSNAFLGLNETAENPQYVSFVNGGAGQQVVQIQLNSSAGAGDGLNDDAVTTIDPVLNVTNQGTQEVNVSFNGGLTTPGIALTGTNDAALNSLAVGDTAQVGIEVAVGDAPRTVNGGNLSAAQDNSDLTLVINATATP